jgi:uncharacterized phage protein gp47/JayE
MANYVTPAVGLEGLVINSYQAILNALLQAFMGVYGQTVYLQPDSADYQFISAIAAFIYDCQSTAQLAYNARSPVTAIGSDLDGIVKLNGLVRKAATFSTALVTVAGVPFTVILAGVCQDLNGFLWNLPANITIPSAGNANFTVTCQSPGNIQAVPGSISIINNPQAGWVSVTNPGAASPGQPIESDSELRARQAISVALPSSTLLAGTAAEVAAVPGVTRSSVLENPTGAVDALGNPPHSITVVVEGGNATAIAQAIYDNKGIGPTVNGTNPATGAIAVVITDPNNGNLSQTIYFYPPTYVPIFVSATIKPFAGYTSATTAAIQADIVTYLNELQIGESVIYSEIYGAALNARPNPAAPLFSITALTMGIAATPTGVVDIPLLFYQVSQGLPANVVLNVL